jgi:F420H(2)-dependent quinone reductase
MSFDTPAGTRGGWQPGTGGPIVRWWTKRAMDRIRRKGKMMGLNALVLTTIGRRSGAERTTPLGWFPGNDGSWLIVAAANGGGEESSLVLQHRRTSRQGPDRDARAQGSRDRRAAPRDRARRGMAADQRRRASVCEVPAEDRPRTADHPPDAPGRLKSPAGVEDSRHRRRWSRARRRTRSASSRRVASPGGDPAFGGHPSSSCPRCARPGRASTSRRTRPGSARGAAPTTAVWATPLLPVAQAAKKRLPSVSLAHHRGRSCFCRRARGVAVEEWVRWTCIAKSLSVSGHR